MWACTNARLFEIGLAGTIIAARPSAAAADEGNPSFPLPATLRQPRPVFSFSPSPENCTVYLLCAFGLMQIQSIVRVQSPVWTSDW
jgi:hypothetical protein